MSFTIVTILFTILAGIAGSLLGESLLGVRAGPGNFLFPCAGRSGLRGLRRKPFWERACRVVWRDWTAIRLFASALRPTKRAPAGCYVLWFEARTSRPSTATPTWRSRSGCPAVCSAQRRTCESTKSASAYAGRLNSKYARQSLRSRLRDQLFGYHRSSSVPRFYVLDCTSFSAQPVNLGPSDYARLQTAPMCKIR